MPKWRKKAQKGHRKPAGAGTAEQQGGRRTKAKSRKAKSRRAKSRKAKSRKVEKGIDLVITASV